ncbi:hypothetical protein [Streptomyces sp. NPDC003374]
MVHHVLLENAPAPAASATAPSPVRTAARPAADPAAYVLTGDDTEARP